VTIARARSTLSFPCRFTLIAAANPCPCGRGQDSGDCECTPASVRGYNAKLSGALADRIDLQLQVDQPDSEALAGDPGESSEHVVPRVQSARERMAKRLGPGRCNAEMSASETKAGVLSSEAQTMLADGRRRLGLSGRGWDRALRVARTIADLGAAERIEAGHVAEALTYRRRGETP
jgi:magnesium chelatase family protein